MPVTALTKRIPYGPHVLLLFILAITIFILLILITFSTPFIPTIYFLTANNINFGAFGWSAPDFRSDDRLGYEFGVLVLKPLTNPMILWGIACLFALLTMLAITPLLWVHDSAALHAVANNTFFKVSSLMLTLILLVTWPLTITGWAIVHRAYNLADVNADPHLGNAIWMGLAALLLSLLLQVFGWPADALGGTNNGGFYHYRQTTREVTRPRMYA